MRIRAKALILAAALALSACASFTPPAPAPLPAHGPILYNCTDGTQLTAEFADSEARVAIVGSYAMVLPRTSGGAVPSYSNGRFAISGGGRSATWYGAGRAGVACTGR